MKYPLLYIVLIFFCSCHRNKLMIHIINVGEEIDLPVKVYMNNALVFQDKVHCTKGGHGASSFEYKTALKKLQMRVVVDKWNLSAEEKLSIYEVGTCFIILTENEVDKSEPNAKLILI